MWVLINLLSWGYKCINEGYTTWFLLREFRGRSHDGGQFKISFHCVPNPRGPIIVFSLLFSTTRTMLFLCVLDHFVWERPPSNDLALVSCLISPWLGRVLGPPLVIFTWTKITNEGLSIIFNLTIWLILYMSLILTLHINGNSFKWIIWRIFKILINTKVCLWPNFPIKLTQAVERAHQ